MSKKLYRPFYLTIIITLLLSVIGPSISLAESTSIKDEMKDITTEAFVIETFEKNKEGILEKVGYQKLNTITETIRMNNKVSTIFYTVEDYYNLDGKFLKSLVKHEEFINDLSTGKALEKKNEIELSEPMTILIEELSVEQNHNNKITMDEQNVLYQYINEQVSQLRDVDYKETQGYTQKELDELVKLANEASKKFEDEKNRLTAANGAYDNYYNTNNYNGSFTIQALSYGKQMYFMFLQYKIKLI